MSRGAALLLASDASILDIALSCGFDTHEGFTRAFRRQFSMPPRMYRRRGFDGGVDVDARLHAEMVRHSTRALRSIVSSHTELEEPT